MSFWTEVSAKIHGDEPEKSTLEYIAADVRSEFSSQFATKDDVLKALDTKHYDYPTLVLRMDRTVKETDKVISFCSHNLNATHPLAKVLAKDHLQAASEKIYVCFTDKACDECGYLCCAACRGYGAYKGYRVHIQFPMMTKEYALSLQLTIAH